MPFTPTNPFVWIEIPVTDGGVEVLDLTPLDRD